MASTRGPNKSNSQQAPSTPKERLEVLSQHLQTKPKKSRRQLGATGPPADYSDVTDQLDQLRRSAATPDLQRRGYVKQKQAGKLWVRERLELLLDSGSFKEVGSVSGTVIWEQVGPTTDKITSYTPSNNVQGVSEAW